MKRITMVIMATAVALLAASSFAEDRALLVGIANYQDPEANLAGPEVDLVLMADIVTRLGFSNQQRRILRDEDATKANILAAINDWLIDGVSEDDRLIFYYSGHGGRTNDMNGEEDDNCDEGLVPYDANLITDDELNQALSRSNAAEIMVIVDSCFSGNVIDTRGAKSVSVGGRQPKLYPKDVVTGTSIIDCNTPTNFTKSTTRDISLAPAEEYSFPSLSNRSVFISATDQDQVAYAAQPGSGQGSLFTQSLANELEGKSSISFNELVDTVGQVIADTVERGNDPRARPHTPTIAAPLEWRSKNFFDFGQLGKGVSAIPYAMDPVLDGIVANKYFNVAIRPDRSSYRIDEEIEFTVTSDITGYLYVYERGASGNLTLLFPNQFNSTPYRVSANQPVRVPSREIAGFRLPASPPTGSSRLIAIVSERNLDLHTQPICGISGGFDFCQANRTRSVDTRLKDIITAASDRYGPAPTASSPRPSGTSFGAGTATVEVTR